MAIRAVLFDFDGTLTEPGSLDFPAIRAAIGCPAGRPILEYIDTLPPGPDRDRARAILDGFETESAARSRPNGGAEELIRILRARGLRTGIFTRNSRRAVERALANFTHLGVSDFDVIVSRDDCPVPKPGPDGILLAARALGVAVDQILVVGDFVFDVEAGRRAGAPTVFLTNRGESPPLTTPPDYVIAELGELREILRELEPLPMGKLPNDLLARFLGKPEAPDALLIAPGVGQDVAAVGLAGEEVLVLKADPVTFAPDQLARYAVTVNCNDVATSGAEPRWLLVTLLFPPGTAAREVRALMADLAEVAREHGLVLCGGHTEITDAVNRPVVSAQVAGTVARDRLIDRQRVRAGDCILVTKAAGIEGTSILARQMPARLAELGMTPGEIARCREFLTAPGIGVLREARIAAASGAVTAMHDVTEGGLATALEELGIACRRRIRVYVESIPVLEETAKLCRLLDLDPLGLIGSGSLLITCQRGASGDLERAIRKAGVDVRSIGEILEEGTGIEAIRNGEPSAWPRFEVDELARLLARNVDRER